MTLSKLENFQLNSSLDMILHDILNNKKILYTISGNKSFTTKGKQRKKNI